MHILLALVLLSSSLSSFACDVSADQFSKIMRDARKLESDPRVPVPTSSVISKKEFYSVIEKVKKKYAPHFENMGLNFRISASWNDPELNAFASQKGKDAWLHLSGGYARAPYMSRDAYYTIICHELGHHLGGFPRKENTWASTEGQSDYYSTAKCMKVILKFDPENRKLARTLKLPPQIKALCRKEHKTEDDYFICLRSAKAAEDYGRAQYFMRTNEDPTEAVSLLLRDSSKVSRTDEMHPKPQCRLDTKLEGALCNIDETIYIGAMNEVQGVCRPKTGTVGTRPACWFASSRK